MGQKTNPKIFQLSKTSNWQSKCFEKKITDYSKYTKKDLEIRNFIEKFFKTRRRTVHQCKICYFEKSLHIFVSYHLSAKLPFLSFGGIPAPDRFEIRKKWREPCKFLQLSNFNCRIVKSYIKQKLYATKHSTKTFKLINFKVLNQMLKYTKALHKQRLVYYKKAFQTLNIIVSKYKEIKLNSLPNAKCLIKPIKLLRTLALVLYYKKIRGNDDKEQKRTDPSETILTEQMTDSLRYFISKNFTLWVHTQALNLNRSVEARKKIKNFLKENLIQLRRYEEEKFYQEGVEMLLTCSTTRKPSALLAQFMSVQLKTLKRHNFFLKFIKDGLKLFNTSLFSKIKRIKIKIRGRLNARPKARSRILMIKNDVSVITIDSMIDYSEKTTFTSNGTLGIKVWIQEFSN